MKEEKIVVDQQAFTVDANRDKLDKLINNMNEHQITNLIDIINVYITLSSLETIKMRINSPEEDTSLHEMEMRGLAGFQNFISKYIKPIGVV